MSLGSGQGRGGQPVPGSGRHLVICGSPVPADTLLLPGLRVAARVRLYLDDFPSVIGLRHAIQLLPPASPTAVDVVIQTRHCAGAHSAQARRRNRAQTGLARQSEWRLGLPRPNHRPTPFEAGVLTNAGFLLPGHRRAPISQCKLVSSAYGLDVRCTIWWIPATQQANYFLNSRTTAVR